jgi:hypothetical protein
VIGTVEDIGVAPSGAFYGPDRFYIRGYPTIKGSHAANDRQTAARLWRVSEELTGVVYPLAA